MPPSYSARLIYIAAGAAALAVIAGAVWGLPIGAGFLLGAAGVFYSLTTLKFALFRTLASVKNPQAAGKAVVMAWLFRLPVTLGLLTVGAVLAKKEFIAWSFMIVLVYFAIVLGAFLQKEPTSADKK